MMSTRLVAQHGYSYRVLTFEVHIAGSRTSPTVIHSGVEEVIRTWRSVAQWTLLVAKGAEGASRRVRACRGTA